MFVSIRVASDNKKFIDTIGVKISTEQNIEQPLTFLFIFYLFYLLNTKCHLHTVDTLIQLNSHGRIQDFTEVGAANILFCENFPKTAWNWKKLNWAGGGVRGEEKILLCRSATVLVTYLSKWS